MSQNVADLIADQATSDEDAGQAFMSLYHEMETNPWLEKAMFHAQESLIRHRPIVAKETAREILSEDRANKSLRGIIEDDSYSDEIAEKAFWALFEKLGRFPDGGVEQSSLITTLDFHRPELGKKVCREILQAVISQ